MHLNKWLLMLEIRKNEFYQSINERILTGEASQNVTKLILDRMNH